MAVLNVSIIVPAFNEEKLLPATLRSIEEACTAFAEIGWIKEVIVCDNNSTDGTAALAQAAGARVVFEPINQISRARNCGAAAATGQWLIFIDADSHPSKALFAAVATVIRQGHCLGGGSTLRIDGPYWVARLVTRSWNLISRLRKWAAGSFIFCEAAAFRAVGGFSEELFATEEINLFKRLKRLARQQRRRIVILHGTPLLTSARKLHLYTPWEHLRFLGKTMLVGGRTLKNREECLTWYDGRR